MSAIQPPLELTQVTEWIDGTARRRENHLAAEEPLEIRIEGRAVTVTMRTPGHDEELAAGFLWTEGLIESAAHLLAIRRLSPEGAARENIVNVELSARSFEPETLQRNFFAASSCGICGKASIDAIRVRGLAHSNAAFRMDPELLCELPTRLRHQQRVFGRTGGLHAAALFNGAGELLVLREDIGRHNAVDKVVGWALMHGLLPLSECAAGEAFQPVA